MPRFSLNYGQDGDKGVGKKYVAVGSRRPLTRINSPRRFRARSKHQPKEAEQAREEGSLSKHALSFPRMGFGGETHFHTKFIGKQLF